jgi:hypothetical protein
MMTLKGSRFRQGCAGCVCGPPNGVEIKESVLQSLTSISLFAVTEAFPQGTAVLRILRGS